MQISHLEQRLFEQMGQRLAMSSLTTGRYRKDAARGLDIVGNPDAVINNWSKAGTHGQGAGTNDPALGFIEMRIREASSPS